MGGAHTAAILDDETALRYAAIMLDPTNYSALSVPCAKNIPSSTPNDCIVMHPQQQYPPHVFDFGSSGADFFPPPVSNDRFLFSSQAQKQSLALFDDIASLPELDHDSSMDSLIFPPTPKSDATEEDDICSNCGLQGQHSTIVPCGHPVCKNCVNTLVNSVCNDGGPKNPTCFLCAEHIQRVQPPQKKTSSFKSSSENSFSSNLNANLDTPLQKIAKFERDFKDDIASEYEKLISHKTECSLGPDTINESSRAWPVIRIDNIPWDLQISELENWLPKEGLISIDEQAVSIHIICSRYDGRTLSHAYVEIRDLSIARSVVRERNGTKLRFRPVSVVLSTQMELLSHIYPSYQAGFTIYGPRASDTSHLVTSNELEELLKLCKLESPHAAKAPERPFLNLASICAKYPWDQKLYAPESTKKLLFNVLREALQKLISLRGSIQLWRTVGEIMVRTIVDCPAFKSEWKSEIFSSCDENQLKHILHPKIKNHKQSNIYSLPDWRNRKTDGKGLLPKLSVVTRKSTRKAKFSPSVSSSKSDCTDGHESAVTSENTSQDSLDNALIFEGATSSPVSANKPPKASSEKLSGISRDLGVDEKVLVEILQRLEIVETPKKYAN